MAFSKSVLTAGRVDTVAIYSAMARLPKSKSPPSTSSAIRSLQSVLFFYSLIQSPGDSINFHSFIISYYYVFASPAIIYQ